MGEDASSSRCFLMTRGSGQMGEDARSSRCSSITGQICSRYCHRTMPCCMVTAPQDQGPVERSERVWGHQVAEDHNEWGNSAGREIVLCRLFILINAVQKHVLKDFEKYCLIRHQFRQDWHGTNLALHYIGRGSPYWRKCPLKAYYAFNLIFFLLFFLFSCIITT